MINVDDLKVNEIVEANLHLMVFGGDRSMHALLKRREGIPLGFCDWSPYRLVHFLYKGMGEFLFFSNEEKYRRMSLKKGFGIASFLVGTREDGNKGAMSEAKIIDARDLPARGVVRRNIEKTADEFNKRYGFEVEDER